MKFVFFLLAALIAADAMAVESASPPQAQPVSASTALAER
jgi:hypothetical protein